MSKLRRAAAVLLLFGTIAASSAYAEENPRNTPGRHHSIVQELVLWLMDQFSSPPP